MNGDESTTRKFKGGRKFNRICTFEFSHLKGGKSILGEGKSLSGNIPCVNTDFQICHFQCHLHDSK